MDEFHQSGARSPAGEREIYTVSRLNREVRRLLETRLPVLWVEGEISNFARPGSGHWYFSLKDASAQVRCAMFRPRNRLLAFTPANGDQVMIRGRVGVYEPRGEYQFIAEHMEPAGEGALRQAFERLKLQLDAEGLFAAEHKRALPALPECIGVITSPTGAALRDILKVLKRRFPAIPVVVYPVAVQGEGAAQQIAKAMQTAARRKECDVIILARGGGSLEDLRAFNEERVARAIYACPVPVVCGVGHEIDVSIADLTADLRAPTPSAAAEMVVPDRAQWLKALAVVARRSAASMRRQLDQAGGQVRALQRRLSLLHPARQLLQHNQRVDEFEQRLSQAMKRALQATGRAVSEQSSHLRRLSPLARVQGLAARHRDLARRMITGMRHRIDATAARLAVSSGTLNAISPLATLERGYAIIRREATGELVRRAGQVQLNEVVTARLSEGQLQTKVIAIEKDNPE